MKPTFALDFRDTAVALLHRTARGWRQVGEAALDAPDLPEALSYMRATALGLSPRGISSKLVIPNGQILYTQVHAPGPNAAQRRKQIAAALVGRTPYEVSELIFDWSGTGPDIQVAVIAKETLAEAEAFAAEHRFNPVSFVAIPEGEAFKGEPWFGPTSFAPSLLASGEKVERDNEVISIVAREPARETPAPEPAPQPVAEPAPVSAQQPDLIEPAPETVVSAPDPEPAAPEIPEPVPAVVPEPVPEVPAPTPEPEPAPAPEYVPEPQPAPQPDWRAAPTPVVDVAVTQSTAAPIDTVDEAPMAVDVADDAPEETAPPVTAGVVAETILDDLPPVPSPAALVAFASRRTADPALAARGDNAAAVKSPILGPADAKPSVPRPIVAKPLPNTGATDPAAARALREANVTALAGRQPAAKPVPPVKSGLRGLGGLVTAPGIPGSKKPRGVTAPISTSATQAGVRPVPPTPSSRLGAKSTTGLGGKPLPQRDRPRFLGLILTALLLVFLALVAAWSTFFLASYQGNEPSDAPTESTAMLGPDAEQPGPDDEMLADMQDPADLAATDDGSLAASTEGDVIAEVTPVEPESAPVAEEPSVAEAVVEAAPAPEVVVESAEALAPSAVPQDEIFLAAMDAPPQTPDALSLPQPEARGDPLPADPVPPPPFGTVYTFDADGRIQPTPEGIITPEGVLLIAGKPPRVPPVRPESVTAAAQAAVPTAGATTETGVTAGAEPFPSDPALSGARPRLRPENLVPPAAQATEDDASLAPEQYSRFATLRPKSRPGTAVAAGEAARQATQSASLTAPADDVVADPSASPLAIAVSMKPAARPKDMSRAVEAAVAAAVRQPEPEPEPQQQEAAAKTAPEADNEPELASAMPALPTKTSVAKQATFVNAINLSKINLIGVYGTSSNRYALVRQANGKYKKVRVGDNLDGGQVAAITSTEVRYQKGGRMVSLALPKG